MIPCVYLVEWRRKTFPTENKTWFSCMPSCSSWRRISIMLTAASMRERCDQIWKWSPFFSLQTQRVSRDSDVVMYGVVRFPWIHPVHFQSCLISPWEILSEGHKIYLCWMTWNKINYRKTLVLSNTPQAWARKSSEAVPSARWHLTYQTLSNAYQKRMIEEWTRSNIRHHWMNWFNVILAASTIWVSLPSMKWTKDLEWPICHHKPRTIWPKNPNQMKTMTTMTVSEIKNLIGKPMKILLTLKMMTAVTLKPC